MRSLAPWIVAFGAAGYLACTGVPDGLRYVDGGRTGSGATTGAATDGTTSTTGAGTTGGTGGTGGGATGGTTAATCPTAPPPGATFCCGTVPCSGTLCVAKCADCRADCSTSELCCPRTNGNVQCRRLSQGCP